jgi:transcription elongation GreA/GreB family factor
MIDPKPNLSRAAIEANIEYYKSICAKYQSGYRDAKEQLEKWEQRLNDLSHHTDK